MTSVLKLLGYLMPSLLALSLPMAMLLGTLLGIGRLSGDLEIVAARACGVSVARLTLPVIILAAVLYPFEVLLALRVVPAASAKLRVAIMELVRTRGAASLPEKFFNRGFDGMVVYFDHIEPTDNRLVNILISDHRNPSARTMIFARSGTVVAGEQSGEITLRLSDGWIFGEDSARDSRRVVRFDVYDLKAAPKQDAALTKVTPLELSMSARRRNISEARLAGHADLAAEIEMAHRWNIPLALFPFALLGITLGLSPVRAGRSERFALALALFFGYYVLMRCGEALTQARVVDSYAGAAMPTLVFICLAVAPFFTRGLDLDRPSRWSGAILRWKAVS